MTELVLGPRAEDFIWASGIEDTFVPQTRQGHRALDEYQLVGHYEHWRADLALARALGVRALRWGVPWYRVEPLPGEFDWSWTDAVLPYMVGELGITPIIDLMHYGCPFWLKREFVGKDYVKSVAAYAAAFARRYKDLVRWYTPLNEPLVNALMCGKRGLWPPYLRGDQGYIRVMLQLARGIVATVNALKEVDPDAVMVHVEAAGLSRAIRQDLEALAIEEQRRGYLAYDLITGQVTPDHPLYTWLLRSGALPDALAELTRNHITLDVMGLNFYPQWSTQHLYVDGRGRLAYRTHEEDGVGFAALINDYYQRYRVPLMITETSAFGAEELRARWLKSSVEAVKYLRSQRVPVLGYTWFPMFTMIDWRYRHGTGPAEQYRIELGLWVLDEKRAGGRWQPTPLVEQYCAYIQNPAESVGPLDPAALAHARRTPAAAAHMHEVPAGDAPLVLQAQEPPRDGA
ncbi:MAG TPA: family 1 glycosylhydrolase [Pyrinomonadaceae bacterium]|jgi:beta-glucosidase/6-phospho-beta-glucosidase/beta-galactosidase